ncbi:MAG: thrombospondin type 3 repeat-containing protein [Candidatus Paceibacterota bacterium]|jgi:hypothetical protein
MKKKVFFLVFGIGGILLLASFVMSGGQDNKASLGEAVSSTAENQTTYSFYKDDDVDGLSNAEEVIFGSSINVTDTDGDGYLDGEEVRNGYDPIKAGTARLSDRENLNASIRYYIWLREEKGISEFKMDQGLLDEFASRYPESVQIGEIQDSDIKLISQDNEESVRKYLADLNKIGLPEGLTSYQEIVKGYDETSNALIDDLLGKIELARLDFSYLETPLSAKEIQKGYLTIVREFSSIFSDLKSYYQNPIQVELNIKKAQKLIDLAQQIENIKLELIRKYQIS